MADPDPRAVLDLSVVEALKALDADGGTSLFAELVELFVEDAERLVRAIEEALAAGDTRTLERSAHTLKSSSASLGAMHLSAICFEIERTGRSGALAGVEPLVRDAAEACRHACRALEAVKA